MSELTHSPLRAYTPARVGLGRAGTAIATVDQLRFQLDHARARDAVHDRPDYAGLLAGLTARGLAGLLLESAVGSGPDARKTYLLRPDLGRRLGEDSAQTLRDAVCSSQPKLSLVIADGLSALAIDRHALPLLDALLPLLPEPPSGPIVIVRNGRVAVGDEIGAILHAELTILLIGERPGLTAPDSLGVYLTSNPRPGRTDAERNCVSNIRTDGLAYAEAARRIVFLLDAARLGTGTGFGLKEGSSPKLPGIG